MRGAGGCGAIGLGATTGADGAAAEITGRAGDGMDVADVAAGADGRIGVTAGCAVEGCALAGDGGATTGRGVTAGTGLGPAAGAGESAAGFTGEGATVVGRLTAAGGAATGLSTAATGGAGVAAGGTGRVGPGAAAVSFRCVIALSTSPGREMFDRSILVLISSSPRLERELDLPAEEEPSAEERMYTRTFSASCSSRELECVFFSVTPTTASVSRIALLFTSSSRARSLIRTLLIRPFGSPCCS